MNNITVDNTSIIVQDNQIQLMDLVNLLDRTISQYGLGLIWLIGNIGSVFNCIVFYQPSFRKSPCAMYFLASSLSQFLAFNFALLTRMLQHGYNFQTFNASIWFCKVRFYFYHIFVANSRYTIIMASMDRYFASSRNALRRQWSSRKIAFRLIIGSAIFWSIIYIHVPVFYQITNDSCQAQSGAYGVFYSIYISIDSGILPIFLMLLFGIMTAKHVRHTRQRVGVTTVVNTNETGREKRGSRKDVQLHRMLANQIVLFIILNLPNPCYLIYRSVTMNMFKSPLRRTTESFIDNATYVLIYLGFALTFVGFVVSSDMFRRELYQFLQTKILHRLPPQTPTERRRDVKNDQTDV